MNLDGTKWHYDPEDVGLACLVYFGEWLGGSLALGNEEVQQFDVVFINSSKIYHAVDDIIGTRIALGFYSTLVKNSFPIPPQEIFFTTI